MVNQQFAAQLPINALNGKVGTGTKMSGKAFAYTTPLLRFDSKCAGGVPDPGFYGRRTARDGPHRGAPKETNT